MLQRIGEQSKQIASQAQAIKFRDAKIERITFELARLKAWKFAAKTERMNAEQRQLFEETLAADEASLEAQLEALQAQAGTQHLNDKHRPLGCLKIRSLHDALLAPRSSPAEGSGRT